MDGGAYAAVLTADEELLDRLLATLAAVGLEPRVVSDPGALRGVWRDATAVTVGADRAEQLAGLDLPRRPDVFVVGDDEAREELCRWSVPLGAAVAPLPAADRWFATALADAAGLRSGAGRLLAVIGGCGGVGASTFAVALAATAGADGRRTVLVDGDPLGGGLDLLLGAEHLDGWRWPQLANARGHLGDLAGELPHVAGVDLLAAGRCVGPTDPGGAVGAAGEDEVARQGAIGTEQLAAVLRSTTRSHDLSVLDVPRWSGSIGTETARQADLTVLLVRADLRGLAAAREVASQLPESTTQVVLRSRRAGPVGPDLVEQTLGLPVMATMADEAAVRRAIERGELPGRSPRSALARSCRIALEQALGRTVRT